MASSFLWKENAQSSPYPPPADELHFLCSAPQDHLTLDDLPTSWPLLLGSLSSSYSPEVLWVSHMSHVLSHLETSDLFMFSISGVCVCPCLEHFSSLFSDIQILANKTQYLEYFWDCTEKVNSSFSVLEPVTLFDFSLALLTSGPIQLTQIPNVYRNINTLDQWQFRKTRLQTT